MIERTSRLKHFAYPVVLIVLALALLFAFLRGNAASSHGNSNEILNPIQGDEDNSLLGQIQQRNPGSLCSLVVGGRARLEAYGAEALVDSGNGPIVLSFRTAAGNSRPQYVGDGISVSGNFVREQVTEPGRVITHQIPVEVHVHGRSENFVADWTCQAKLIVVKTR